MFFFLSLQWQAGSRQQETPPGFEPDRNNWGWNWLERWMAVRPWENRFLDINLRDGVTVHENKSAEENNETSNQIKPFAKKSVANTSNTFQKQGVPNSGGSGSSSSRSANVLTTSTAGMGKIKPRISAEKLVEEANSKPGIAGSRSYNNPRDRPGKPNAQAQKRLSLPNSSEC